MTRPSASSFISCALDNMVCKVATSLDKLSMLSMASTICSIRSAPHPSRQGSVRDLNRKRGSRRRSSTARKGAGTDRRPFLSIRFSNVDKNNSTKLRAPVFHPYRPIRAVVAKTARCSPKRLQRLARRSQFSTDLPRFGLGGGRNPEQILKWDNMGYHGILWKSMGFTYLFMGKCNLFNYLI